MYINIDFKLEMLTVTDDFEKGDFTNQIIVILKYDLWGYMVMKCFFVYFDQTM